MTLSVPHYFPVIEKYPRIHEIDGLRGSASLVVVTFHFTWETFGFIQPSITNGYVKFFLDGPLAVYIFFVLSGDALSTPFLHSRNMSIWQRAVAKRYLWPAMKDHKANCLDQGDLSGPRMQIWRLWQVFVTTGYRRNAVMPDTSSISIPADEPPVFLKELWNVAAEDKKHSFIRQLAYPSIDGLRFYAAFIVFWHHFMDMTLCFGVE